MKNSEQLRAVIYARYSSDNQREESIEGQLRECNEFAKKNGMFIIANYIDRAFSAKTDNRPEFQRMIKDSSKKGFDVVIVWKLDRFSRNRYDSAKYKAALKKNNVRVVSATEAISQGAEGIILESVLEGMAEYYSADLAEKVTRGMTENALKCKFNGSTVPFGYIIDKDKHYQLDPIKAPVALEIFERYASNEPVKSIISDLNIRGIKTSGGSCFTKNSFRHMIKNRIYIGEYHFNGIVIPNGVPAIVPEDIFNSAGIVFDKNKQVPAKNKAKEEYLLTTKLFCGNCLSMMVGECGKKSNGNIYRYYKCVGAKKHTCNKRAVRKEWIEDMAIKLIFDILLNEKDLKKIADNILKLQSSENTVIPVLERQLADVQACIDNVMKAIEMGVCTRTTKNRLEEFEAEEQKIKDSIYQEKLNSPTVTEEQIWYIFDKLRNLDLTMPRQRRKLIDSFLHSIVLYDDRLVISFNYREQPKTVVLTDILKSSDSKMSASPNKKRMSTDIRFLFGYLCH